MPGLVSGGVERLLRGGTGGRYTPTREGLRHKSVNERAGQGTFGSKGEHVLSSLLRQRNQELGLARSTDVTGAERWRVLVRDGKWQQKSR